MVWNHIGGIGIELNRHTYKAREKQLMLLQENPEIWQIVEKLLKSESDHEAWENNPVRPILESFRKIQNLIEDDLEERIFEVTDKFVPSEKTPEPEPKTVQGKL